jgi:hypothetical protein
MMVTSSPPTVNPAQPFASVLSPKMKVLIESRLHRRAEKNVPNPKYPQLEERVSLLQTVGRQPLSFREVALSVLAASVFSVSWNLANKVNCTYFNFDATKKRTSSDLMMKSLVKVEMKDALGLNKPVWYYEAPNGLVGSSRTASYWKQWEEPSVEGNSQQRYFRHEQTKPLNPAFLGKANVKIPSSEELVGGLKQTYCCQDLSSKWTDADSVTWTVQHAKQIKESKDIQKNKLGQYSEVHTTVETNVPILESLSLDWMDNKDKALEHHLCVSHETGITYTQSKSSSFIGSVTKELSLDQIKAGEFKTLLETIPYLPSTLKNLETLVMIETATERNKIYEITETAPFCKISLPVEMKMLTDPWWVLQEKNQPVAWDVQQNISHKASHFLLPSVIGVVGAGLGLGVFHWWKEKKRNQEVVTALAKAKTPETITYAQAKKYNLLG